MQTQFIYFYVGFEGSKIWTAIYKENCFDIKIKSYESMMKRQCLEKKAFYRAISGLHSSITIHLTAEYPLYLKEYGFNLEEFKKRFQHVQGLFWISNLYYTYWLQMVALKKISPFLKNHHYFTGIDRHFQY